jgi:hypothetical protein
MPPPPSIFNPQMSLEHVWWLVNLSSKQLIAAYEDTRFGTLREMTLPRCVEVWGWNPPEAAENVNGSGSPVGEWVHGMVCVRVYHAAVQGGGVRVGGGSHGQGSAPSGNLQHRSLRASLAVMLVPPSLDVPCRHGTCQRTCGSVYK